MWNVILKFTAFIFIFTSGQCFKEIIIVLDFKSERRFKNEFWYNFILLKIKVDFESL